MSDEIEKSLSDEATFAGRAKPEARDVSLSDERTLGGGADAAGLDTVMDDIEVVDLEARYTIEGTLGKGGMGAVLLATDTRLHRKVAIKRILGESARSATAVSRFITEARSVAALNHPNIVQIYDYGRAKDGPFLIMEYLDGGDLLSLSRDGAIDADRAVNLISQVCDGLGVAHDMGIVHRDIKPANVLLSKSGVPKLTDFGLAKAETSDHQMTMAGAVIGTLDFMPPEQRRDASEVDARSDLWSLAATLYQLVTGRSPKVIRLHEVPQSLQAVLAKALEDQKTARYQSAREFAEALQHTGGKPIAAPAVTLVEGEPQEGLCSACGTVNADASRKFCKKCGESLRTSCLNCEAQIPVWDTICGECGGHQESLLEAASLFAEAREHRKAFDYASAIRSLEKIPKPLLGTEMERLLAKSRRQQEESSRLLADIAARVKAKEIEGLIPDVTRAIKLKGDRSDLVKLRDQLIQRRDVRFTRAESLLQEGNARAAAAMIDGVSVNDVTPDQRERFTEARRLATIEEYITALVKAVRTDGGLRFDTAVGLAKHCEEYLAAVPHHSKIQEILNRCRSVGIENSLGMNMIFIRGGSFTMGQAGRSNLRVTLPRGFYLATNVVTEAQWGQVMGDDNWATDFPMVGVSWNHAVSFCEHLSALPEERAAGRVYRLPTEAEWEYACRAGTTTNFSFGDIESFLGDFAWFDYNSSQQRHPVGEKKPNPWGLYDMHGNVWEWCSDWYGRYAAGSATDPRGLEVGSARVLRGGSWTSSVACCRSAYRHWLNPSNGDWDVGFRVALSLPGE